MRLTKYRSMREPEVIQELSRKLGEILPNLRMEETQFEVPIDSTTRADIIIEVSVGNIRKKLLVEVKSIGEPKLAKNAIFQLKRYVKKIPETYPVFAAPYVSERTRQICIQEGVGYLDLSGNAYLQFDSVLIDRVSKNSNKIERSSTRGIFSAKATRVIRALLEKPLENMRVTDIAYKCDMSPAGVYYVLNQLEDKGYIVRTEKKEIKVVEAKRLLLDWANNWKVEKNPAERYFSFARSVDELIDKINSSARELDYKYALTGMAGASLVSPFVRYNDVWLYLSGDSEKLIKELDLRPVLTGANVVILKPYDKGVFMGEREIRGKNIVSDIQLFLDLYKNPARGEEQAKWILDKKIKFEDE